MKWKKERHTNKEWTKELYEITGVQKWKGEEKEWKHERHDKWRNKQNGMKRLEEQTKRESRKG